MTPIRKDRTTNDREEPPSVCGSFPAVLAAESLRNAALPADSPRGDERISTFWRIFGGTLLSIAALVCITVYQQFNNTLNELRSAVAHLNEGRADLVRKDEYNSRNSSLWNGLKEAQTASAATVAVKERQALLEQQLKSAEEERRELAREVKRLSERLAAVEGRQGAHDGKALDRQAQGK